jgi:hypothetical protein
MEQKEMFGNNQHNFNIWYETYDPSFVDINLQSRVPLKWMIYKRVLEGQYKDSVIKPLNKYIERLYPKPKLISINKNIVRLRQYTHADIFLLVKETGLYDVDRPWIRQYYQTKFNPGIPNNCFDKVYKFYLPWFIDEDIEIFIDQPQEDSPFHIYPQTDKYFKINSNQDFVEPMFVPFSFKKEGEHMIDAEFGIIKKPSPMFDIIFNANDILLQRVRNFYGQD